MKGKGEQHEKIMHSISLLMVVFFSIIFGKGRQTLPDDGSRASAILHLCTIRLCQQGDWLDRVRINELRNSNFAVWVYDPVVAVGWPSEIEYYFRRWPAQMGLLSSFVTRVLYIVGSFGFSQNANMRKFTGNSA